MPFAVSLFNVVLLGVGGRKFQLLLSAHNRTNRNGTIAREVSLHLLVFAKCILGSDERTGRRLLGEKLLLDLALG